MLETIIERSHDELTAQRHAGNYSFNWTEQEETKAPEIIANAANDEAVVWKCRDCKAEFGFKPTQCVHCECKVIDGIPF